MTTTEQYRSETNKITSKKISYLLLFSAIVGGVGGAILLGVLLESIARSIFGLEEPNFVLMAILGSLVGLLSALGTGVLVAAFYIQNRTVKSLTIIFSLPVPILIEVIDLTLRFMNLIPDIYSHYSIPM